MAGSGDPHFNLFHAYRGSVADELGRRRQLEDNLTRALGIVLSRLRGTPLAASLLSELGVAPALHHKPFEVQFQVAAVGASWPSPDRRRLVAIVAGGPEDTPGEVGIEADRSAGARPDLVLLWDTDALVVESEVTPGPDKPQMNRMHLAFATQGSGATYQQTTWHSVAKIVRDIARHAQQPTRYVLEQFEEYMRVNGFGGFADEHFAYFAMSVERRQTETVTRIGARRALENLLVQLKTKWEVTWRLHVGNLNTDDQRMWGNLAPDGGAAPHLSLEVGADGLSVFANVETQRPFARFRNAWLRDPASFVQFFTGLAEDEKSALERNPWSLAVKRRLQKLDAKGTIVPRKFWYLPATEISASAASVMPGLLGPLIDGAVCFADRGEAAPEITVSRHYEPWQVLDHDFLDHLVADARRTEEFFTWLGVPCR